VYNFRRASSEVVASWKSMADQVSKELQLAGLPVVRTDAEAVGAEIEIDEGGDEEGGVYVKWYPDPQLWKAAADSVQQGRLDEPVIQRSGTVKTVMCGAISEILQAAGFVIGQAGDLRPLTIRVIASPMHSSRKAR